MQVQIITAACENMIDGRGMRLGDILQAAKGKTVEVSISPLLTYTPHNVYPDVMFTSC